MKRAGPIPLTHQHPKRSKEAAFSFGLIQETLMYDRDKKLQGNTKMNINLMQGNFGVCSNIWCEGLNKFRAEHVFTVEALMECV